jgi:hypothetical protein
MTLDKTGSPVTIKMEIKSAERETWVRKWRFRVRRW